MSQEVRVDAAPPVVDVNTSSVGQVIENKRIMDLPLNGRGVFNLANLTPAVNPTGGGATPGHGRRPQCHERCADRRHDGHRPGE